MHTVGRRAQTHDTDPRWSQVALSVSIWRSRTDRTRDASIAGPLDADATGAGILPVVRTRLADTNGPIVASTTASTSTAPSMPTLSPGMSFDDAARAVLTFLRERLPMGLWSVTRHENGPQTYLHLDDQAYGLERGGSPAWEDSFCIKMIAGEAPRVAPDGSEIPIYRDQPGAQQIPIGAYAGIPILDDDGELFGTLCGPGTGRGGTCGL